MCILLWPNQQELHHLQLHLLITLFCIILIYHLGICKAYYAPVCPIVLHIFHIAGNMSTWKLTQPVSPRMTADMRRKSKFLNEMHTLDWHVMCCLSMTLNVHTTHSIKCYRMLKSNVFRIKDTISHIVATKTLLTLALKESIKKNNKIYVNHTKGKNTKIKKIKILSLNCIETKFTIYCVQPNISITMIYW